jgi:hypothetical protein
LGKAERATLVVGGINGLKVAFDAGTVVGKRLFGGFRSGLLSGGRERSGRRRNELAGWGNRHGFSGLRDGLGGFERAGRSALLGLEVRVKVYFERPEAFEIAEGIAEVALGGVDHALEAGEGAVREAEGMADGGILVEFVSAIHFVGKNLGFGDGEAAEGPGGADQDIDEVALLGDSGAEALEVLLEEGVEIGRIFAGDGEGLGVDAGFQRIHAGAGLALGGARTCGIVVMGAIGAGLRSFHLDCPLKRKGQAHRGNFSLGEASLLVVSISC